MMKNEISNIISGADKEFMDAMKQIREFHEKENRAIKSELIQSELESKMKELYLTNPTVNRAINLERLGDITHEQALMYIVVGLSEHLESVKESLINLHKNIR